MRTSSRRAEIHLQTDAEYMAAKRQMPETILYLPSRGHPYTGPRSLFHVRAIFARRISPLQPALQHMDDAAENAPAIHSRHPVRAREVGLYALVCASTSQNDPTWAGPPNKVSQKSHPLGTPIIGSGPGCFTFAKARSETQCSRPARPDGLRRLGVASLRSEDLRPPAEVFRPR